MLVVVAALGAGVLAALIIATGIATRERDRALKAQSHSYEVMILTRSLAGSIAHAEATLGRFVISADKKIGLQFGDQWQQAGLQIDRLDSITNDNPTQQGRVFALRQAYQERGDELSLIALSTQYKRNDQAIARYYAARNAPALARIDTILDGFIDSERDLLSKRSAAAERKIAQSNLAVKIFAGFGALLVIAAIILGWLVVLSSSERAYAAAEAETERNRAEELEVAVAEAVAGLEAEAREREVAESKLRQMQKLDAVGQLTGGIAHDFNNMLAVVLGGIELAKRRLAEGGDAVRHLDNAAEGANRASALTKRLLAFARAEPLLPRALDPTELIAGMSDLLDRTLGDGVQLEVVDEADGWCIWADSDGLENAILNLAVNARDAMDGRGRLTIAAGLVTLAADAVGHNSPGDYVTIGVSDTGTGMAPEVIERVFDPFFTTKPVGKGTGLGLSQVFGFVKQSHGEVAITSNEGEGTTVTLYIPRYHSSIRTAKVVPIAPEAPTLQRSHDILVVEDDPRVLTATVELLTELGHRPVSCDDPMEAMAKAGAMANIDLIISDVLMPNKTGPELVTELAPAFPDAAVLFVTGYAGEAQGNALGGHKVLRKPFTIAGLARAIDDAIDGREHGPPRQIVNVG